MISFFSSPFILDYALLIAFFLLIGILSFILSKLKIRKLYSYIKQIYFPTLVLSILGLTIGTLSGNSRLPIMGAVIPAILTFASGFTVYIVNSKKGVENNISLSAIFFFAFFLIIGTWAGANNRVEKDKEEKEWEIELLRIKRNNEVIKYKQQKLIDQQFKEIYGE